MKTVEIINGNSLEVLKGMEDGSVDLFIQDLPYGTTQNKWDTLVDLDAFWKEWLRVGKEDCAFVFTAQQPFTSTLVASNMKLFRYQWIWEKSQGTGFLNANRMPLKAHEDVLIFYRKLPTYNPQMIKLDKPRKHKRRGDATSENYGKFKHNKESTYTHRHPTDIVHFPKEANTWHPTQKPVSLYQYFIRTYSNEGETVFDGFGGAGTCGIAALRENRKAIIVEKEKSYFKKAKLRIAEEVNQYNLFEKRIWEQQES